MAKIAGCAPRKKIEKIDYENITDLLMDGKYPGPKKEVLYSGIANGQLEKATLVQVNNKNRKLSSKKIKLFLRGDEMFQHFNKLVLAAVERCYGREFKEHFHEWHRPKIIRRMTMWGVNYKKEVAERNALIRLVVGNKS